MNTLGLTLTLLSLAIVLFCSRTWALLAVMGSVCYLTQNLQVNLGFHCTAIRLVLLAGIIRVIARGENKEMGFNRIDKMVLIYVCFLVVIGVCGRGTMVALVNFVGAAYNMLLSYFLFRSLLRNYEESKDFLAKLAILMAPFAAIVLFEAATGRSLFTEVGLLDADLFERGGHFRAQGSFRSPNTLGMVGATFVPIYACLCFVRERRFSNIIGLIVAISITVASHSSGALMGLVAGLIALAFWRWRERMRFVRRAIVFLLVALALVMNAPVWYIFARVSDITGGDGWHRSAIIDQAYKHLGTWWLAGTDDTGGWMPYQLMNGASDITNQFLQAGVSGGLLTMLLFIWIIVRCFQSLGWAQEKARERSPLLEWHLWGLGAALTATVVNFMSVCYFDQSEEVFYLLLAMISAAVVTESASAGDEGKDDIESPHSDRFGREISSVEVKETGVG